MAEMPALLALADALELVLDRAETLTPESVAVDAAYGRVLARPALATVDLPPFRSSAMDGYALHAQDAPATLPIVDRIAAGDSAVRKLSRGEAMAIATGGVVPEGADAVIPFEHVVNVDNSILIDRLVARGANIRQRGSDVTAGSEVVPAGTRLGARQLGALAAAGIAEASCGRRPRAAVLSTGSELQRAGEPLEPGQVYEANGLLLAAALGTCGAEVERLPSVRDDEHAHRAALERGLAADVLVTSGGVSVGPHDLVRRTLAELGVTEIFWGVAVKPGKPVSFGTRGATLVFGLPGNPVSALVGFELFVRPALLALQGAASPRPQFEVGRLSRAVRQDPGRDALIRARTSLGQDGILLEPLSGQESHMIARAAAADALILLPLGEGELIAGSAVRYLRLTV